MKIKDRIIFDLQNNSTFVLSLSLFRRRSSYASENVFMKTFGNTIQFRFRIKVLHKKWFFEYKTKHYYKNISFR